MMFQNVILISILRGCKIKICSACVYVLELILYTVCVWLLNGSEQAESYLLFHVGFDFPPRGEEGHILYHYREGRPHCQCRERKDS